MAVADDGVTVDVLTLFSYPVHPPGKPERARTEHLPRIGAPTVFTHGTADPFGTLEELRAAAALLYGPPTAIVESPGAPATTWARRSSTCPCWRSTRRCDCWGELRLRVDGVHRHHRAGSLAADSGRSPAIFRGDVAVRRPESAPRGAVSAAPAGVPSRYPPPYQQPYQQPGPPPPPPMPYQEGQYGRRRTQGQHGAAYAQQPYGAPKNSTSPWAIVALILGIVGVILFQRLSAASSR